MESGSGTGDGGGAVAGRPAEILRRPVEGIVAHEHSLEGAGAYAQDVLRVLRLLWELSGLDAVLATRVDTAADRQHITAALIGGRPESVPPLVWTDSVCVRMSTGAGPQVAPDIAGVPLYADAPGLIGTGMHCYVGSSILRGDGELYGTVCGFGAAPRDATMHALVPGFDTAAELLGSILAAAHVADERLTDARTCHTRELRAALTDPVTGLLNRTGFEQAYAREHDRHQRYGSVVTVMVCDVDGLKAVNDTSGHAAGDALLADVGTRLRTRCRASDVLGRTGGDEFVVVLPGEHADGPAVTRLREALVALPVSVGAADTRYRSTLGQARTSADRAMYEAKSARKGAGGSRSGFAAGPPPSPGTAVVSVDGAGLGTVHRVFRDLASGIPTWASVLTRTGGVVALPLGRGVLTDGVLSVPFPADAVLAAPRLRTARVMTPTDISALERWYAHLDTRDLEVG